MKQKSLKYKLAIIKRYYNGESIHSISKSESISRSTLYHWLNTYHILSENRERTLTVQDYIGLEMQKRKLENKIAIMNISTITHESRTMDKIHEIQRLSKYGFSINELCEVFKISKSTYFRRIQDKHKKSYYDLRREKYKQLILDVFDDHQQMIGSEKIAAILCESGYPTTQKYVSKLMKELNISSIRNESKKRYKQLKNTKKENLVKRKFIVDAPNKVWISDISEFRFKNNTYYLCVIIDLYARRVIAHKLSMSSSTYLLTSCMRKALSTRVIDNSLIFHCDRGNQYKSYTFGKLLIDNEIKQSYSKARTPHDNSVMESFFASYKQEEFYRRAYSSKKQLLQYTDRYITYYNEKRPHSTNNNLPPKTKEDRYYERINSQNHVQV